MSTFTNRGFTVSIVPWEEGFLYFADNGEHEISDPNPHHDDGMYLSEEDAEAAAKEHIYLHDINCMLVELTSDEQEFIEDVISTVLNEGIVFVASSTRPSLSNEGRDCPT